MVTIYFDESGNMGFDLSKSGTKNHVLITFLIMKECRPVMSLVKKVFLTLPKIIKRRRGAELHAHHEKPVTIKRLLKGLSVIEDVRIATMRLDKRKIVLIGNPNELYSNMVRRFFVGEMFAFVFNIYTVYHPYDIIRSRKQRFDFE